MIVVFSPAEKAEMFDEIASKYYSRNFGVLPKSEIDLMMFGFLLRKLLSQNKRNNGIIDYSACSDYRIATELGITEQKVRSLKVRYHLKYGDDFDWRPSFADLIEKARFDPATRKVTVNIPDPNLFREIQNFIEENGAFVEKQLNGKILQIRVEYFLELAVASMPESSRKAIIMSLKKQFRDCGKDEKKFDEKNIGKSLIDGALDITTVAANIASIISPGNLIGEAIIKLIVK